LHEYHDAKSYPVLCTNILVGSMSMMLIVYLMLSLVFVKHATNRCSLQLWNTSCLCFYAPYAQNLQLILFDISNVITYVSIYEDFLWWPLAVTLTYFMSGSELGVDHSVGISESESCLILA